MNGFPAVCCLGALLVVGIFTRVAVAVCDGSPLRSENSRMTLSQKIEMYRNTSTAPSFVKIKINDARSKKILNMVVENDRLAGFMASEHRVPEENLAKFYECDYVEWMLKNHDKPLDLDIEKFENYLAETTFGSKSVTKEYLRKAIFEAPMTFHELQVQSEEELIEKYFSFDRNKNIGNPKPGFAGAYDPRFIALLIDLGYVVSRGDLVPILRIHKP